MEREQTRKQKILIADDSEMNRSILADMLGDEYEILEAENGVQAVTSLQKYYAAIDLVLLDIMMPEMDGFGVLDAMNARRWIEDIPVIMISSENSPAFMERAYALGVTDFISRPFDALVVRRRVVNTLLLYAKQKRLSDMVADQIYENEQRSSLMIDILSHIVEFRNGESGLHVVHIRILTELLLEHLVQITDRYPLSQADISLISMASALHDIGKIAIPSEILNKPGKLTEYEFGVMRTHALIGAQMLDALPVHRNEPLVKTAYDICRWHHERWNGGGYPDGLKGDRIPISAQAVAMADVYDALTSERVYKRAYSHETAIRMIHNGECGDFNPLLIQCLDELSDLLPRELVRRTASSRSGQEVRLAATREMLDHAELGASRRTLQLLEHERMKYSFFAAMSQEIQFEYEHICEPSLLTLSSAWAAEKLGMDEVIVDPVNDPRVREIMDGEDLRRLGEALRATTPEDPVVRYDCRVNLGGELRWYQIIARAIWTTEDETGTYAGCIGKAVDVNDERMRMAELEKKASHDTLTGLLNHASARERILRMLADGSPRHYAMILMDMDKFKDANDTYGHIFGDHVLIYTADRLRQCIRGGDVAARAGGDEFLVFFSYDGDPEPVVDRIFKSLCGRYESFPIVFSMGVALTDRAGKDYTRLFHRADQALYAAKKAGRGQYKFYDDSMRDMFSALSPIDGGDDPSESAASGKKEERP